MNHGKFIFFLDGFDELNSEVKQKVISSLNSFINRFDSNRFILTTRPYSDIEQLPLFHNYHVKGLDKETGEIEGFIHKQLHTESELAKKIVQSIKTNKSEYIESFLKNPLLLSLYILTFQSDSSVPSKKYIFYRRVINALFSEHDSKTKLGFPRERFSNLNQEEFENVLKAFCFISFFESKFNWDADYVSEKLVRIKAKLNDIHFDNNHFIKDLKLAVALWVDDNGILSFAHRSLQEYFAALFIKHLNPTETQRIYNKIINRFSDIRNLNEIENFLSLCEEMDEINFKKHYSLPLLYELRSQLDITNAEEAGKSFLLFFANGINFSKTKDRIVAMPVEINERLVYKAIYFHLPYTRRLYQILQDLSYKHKLKECNSIETKVERKHPRKKITEHRPEIVNQIPLTNGSIPDDFWTICRKEVIDLTKEYIAFLDKSIEDNEKFIKNTEGLDKELVDLI